VTKFLHPSVAGLLLQKELDYLDGAVKEPKRPFVAIVGGSKVSSKIGVIESLLEKTDKIILGYVHATYLMTGALISATLCVRPDRITTIILVAIVHQLRDNQ